MTDGVVAMADPPAVPDEREMLQQVDVIAEIGYEAVRTLETISGEEPVAWCDLPPERVADVEAGVRFVLDNPNAPLAAQHDAWVARNRQRLAADDPRLVSFDQLPFGQQLKARIWRHIVHAVVG
jgi:hypothetical protein